jgi:arsenical pump membrane protein
VLVATVASLAVLLAVLLLIAWGRIADALVTAVAASLVVAVGLVGIDQVREVLDRLGSTLAFLAAIFVLAEVARAADLFDALGAVMARGSGSSPRQLLLVVSAAAIAVTVVLSLDATAVLFTPIVIHVVRARGARSERPLLATTQLANASSGWLPVSNLTNLLVFSATGLTFGGFALRMALPTAAASAVVVTVAARGGDRTPLPIPTDPDAQLDLDWLAWFVVAAFVVLVAAFFIGSAVGIEPAVIAAVGAVFVGTVALVARRTSPARLVSAASPRFLLFVVGLAVVVQAAVDHGLGDAARTILPSGSGLAALFAVTVIAAVLANLVNNVPATLLLISVVPAGAVQPLLAVLVGVNIGPNLTYTGSLATLLWRRVVRAAGAEPGRREFFRLALLATPLALVLATLILWLSLEVTG